MNTSKVRCSLSWVLFHSRAMSTEKRAHVINGKDVIRLYSISPAKINLIYDICNFFRGKVFADSSKCRFCENENTFCEYGKSPMRIITIFVMLKSCHLPALRQKTKLFTYKTYDYEKTIPFHHRISHFNGGLCTIVRRCVRNASGR